MFSDITQFQLWNILSRAAFRPIAHQQNYLMDRNNCYTFDSKFKQTIYKFGQRRRTLQALFLIWSLPLIFIYHYFLSADLEYENQRIYWWRGPSQRFRNWRSSWELNWKNHKLAFRNSARFLQARIWLLRQSYCYIWNYKVGVLTIRGFTKWITKLWIPLTLLLSWVTKTEFLPTISI